MALVTHIDFVESNFGYGPHALWDKAGREAWHKFYDIPMEGCCDHEPDTDRSEGLKPIKVLPDRWIPPCTT
jgi:hypothetical protein